MRWFPRPANFWVAVMVLFFTGVIYLGIQENNDIKDLSNSLNTVYQKVDKIEDRQKEAREIIDKTHERVKAVDETVNPSPLPPEKPDDVAEPAHPAPVSQPQTKPVVVQHHFYHHHYYRQPSNPIADFLHHIFH